MLNNLALVYNTRYLVFVIFAAIILNSYKPVFAFAIFYSLIIFDIINIGFLESYFFNKYFANNLFFLIFHSIFIVIAVSKVVEIVTGFFLQDTYKNGIVSSIMTGLLIVNLLNNHLEKILYKSDFISPISHVSGPLRQLAKKPLIYTDEKNRLWQLHVIKKLWEVENLSGAKWMTVTVDGKILSQILTPPEKFGPFKLVFNAKPPVFFDTKRRCWIRNLENKWEVKNYLVEKPVMLVSDSGEILGREDVE